MIFLRFVLLQIFVGLATTNLWAENVFAEILHHSSEKFSVSTQTTDATSYRVYLLASKEMELRLTVGTKPFYDSILPTGKDLYFGYADTLVSDARLLDREKSKVSASLRSHEPESIVVAKQEFFWGVYYFQKEATDTRPILGITTMYKNYPLYITGRMNQEVDENLVRQIIGMIWKWKD